MRTKDKSQSKDVDLKLRRQFVFLIFRSENTITHRAVVLANTISVGLMEKGVMFLKLT